MEVDDDNKLKESQETPKENVVEKKASKKDLVSFWILSILLVRITVL